MSDILKDIPNLIAEINSCNDPHRLIEVMTRLSGYAFHLAEEVGKLNTTFIQAESLRKEMQTNLTISYSKADSMALAKEKALSDTGDHREAEARSRGLFKALELKLQALYENIWSLKLKIRYLMAEKIQVKDEV